MKKSFLKKLSLGLTAVMLTVSLAACGNNNTDNTADPGTTQTNQGEETGDSTEGAESSSDNTTLVAGLDHFSSKFSPYFSKTVVDRTVSDLISIKLLDWDREGNVILNGIEGETIAFNGTDHTYNGIADCEIVQNDDGTVDYNFTIREDIIFSDGTPLTIDDVIFSMYVYNDPTYDGSATLYSVPIVGLEEYRSGMVALMNLIIEAGPDNTDFTNFTEEQQEAFWSAVEVAGPKFAQDIIDYCVASSSDHLEEVGGSEVALGMYAWGFGTPSEDGSAITGAGTGTEYETASVTAEDYWNEIFASYEGDIQEASDTETANTDLFTYLEETLGDDMDTYLAGVNVGESADAIEGIQKTGDYSMTVTTSKFDAVTIYNFTFAFGPLHYYGSTDLYDYDNNMFGFPKGDLSLVKAKTTQPLGAGPYRYESFENGVVTMSANENYYKGEPKIQSILFKEATESDKLSGLVSGAYDVVNPALSLEVLDSVKDYNSNGELSGDKIETNLVDNLGYGYIGISSDNVKVGNDIGSEESRNLRNAFATLYAVYRDTVINSYYGEMAAVIQYPISNTSWAAPKPADEGYTIAYSKDVDGNPIYTSGMTEEEKYEAAMEAAVGFFQAAGYTYDEDAGVFTAAPAGAAMSYEVIIPAGGDGSHPSFGILTAVKEALSDIGITLEINDPADSSVLWTKTESGTAEMWVAAWQATADPDLYQVYHSTNAVGEGGTDSNTYGIRDAQLDELIMAARESADQPFRKATYKDALDIIIDWAVEIPVYQRQNAILLSSERIKVDTFTPDVSTFWEWYFDIENLELK